MNVPLDPVTLSKLEDFGRRRRRLILARGVCAALAILLGTMSVIAFVDWLLVLPDLARWILSVLGYGLVIAGVWVTCARLVLRRPSARELARFVEKTRPELREDLLSAVELGESAEGESWDSMVFRRLLQEDVAGRVRDLPVADLLSWERISRWVRVAAAIVIACAALVLVPGLSFDHLLLRSMLPMANLERISRVKVSVVAPEPPDAIVPEGDTVTVRVITAGPEHGSVLLETFPRGGRGERAEMKALPDRKYEAVIALQREPLDYRVRAGDAITRRYKLLTRPRPEVARFQKTYRYPAYTRRPAHTVTAENGDLEALESTEVDLELETNQEVRSGELRVEQGGKPMSVRLESAGPRRLRVRMPILASGLYRVHLVAAETGFENKFSPQYEIRSLPDQLPRVAIEEPQQDLIVPPDEVVELRGTAKDDIGLERVIQMVRVNQGEWSEVPLGGPDLKTEKTVTRQWDLFDQRVQPGDRLTTKLVAVDLKGNRAESAPVHVVITSPGFDPQRLMPLEAKRRVYAGLVALREAARAMEKKVQEAVQAVDSGGEIQRTQVLLNLAGEMEKVSQQADAAESRIKDALRVSRAGREASDLIGAGIIVRRVRDDSVQGARSEFQRASAATGKAEIQASMNRASEAFRRTADRASTAEECWREILASEEAVAALLDLRDLARDEAAINRQVAQSVKAKDPKVWERLARRQGVAGNQVKGVEEILRALTPRARDGMEKRVEKIAQDLQNTRTLLENGLAQPPADRLLGLSQGMQGQVDAALSAHHQLERELAQKAAAAREALARRAGSSSADLNPVQKELLALADLEEKKKQDKDQTARAAERWKASRELLEARASLEECRRDSDPFFVSDASLASRALGAVMETWKNVGGPARANKTVKEIEQAFRTLEAGHAVAELTLALRELGERERWEGPTPNASVRHPKDWTWMDDRMKTVPEELRGARLPQEAVQALQKSWSGPEGERMRREMGERLHRGRRPVPVADALERLAADAGKAMLQIQPPMEEARAFLRKLVPSLPERLAMLAEEARKMEQATSQLAQKAKQDENAPVRPEAKKLLDSQQGLDREVQDAMTQIRRDANMQDLFTKEGRERARDADDAVAMLTQTPPKAEDLLNEAAAAPERPAQSRALSGAAEQQDKMADALKTLADHYRNVETGKPEETRPELRKAEEALGIKDAMDAQYGQMEQLAEMARQQNKEALMQALENALAGNETMQRKLEQLANNALDRAEAALQDAEAREQQTRESLQQQSQQQSQQQAQKASSVADQARKIAEQARQMAQQDAPQVAQKTPAAKSQAEAAAKDLQEAAAAVPQDFSQPQPAAQGMENAAKELNDAAKDLRAAQQTAHQAADQASQNAQKEQREAQAAQQSAQQAQQKSQQSGQAAQKAQEKSQQAQQAAQKEPANAAAQQAAQQAQQQAQQAAQQAQQAQQAAQQAQQAAQAEAAQAQQAQQSQQQAQSGEAQAAQAAQKAEQLAQQAQQLANQLRQSSQPQAAPQMAQQAAQQGDIGKTVDEAAGDISRAARHMERLGFSEQAQTYEQVAQSTGAVADKEVPAAQKALESAKSPGEAQPAVAAAEQAIESQLSQLGDARQQPASQTPSPSQTPQSGLSESAAEFMANALNALDQAMNSEQGQQGQQGQQPGQGQPQQGPSAAQAMASAAAAQAQSMRQGRTPGQGQQPGQTPSSQQSSQGAGASVEAGELQPGQIPATAALKKGDWGRLPPRLARDLMEAQRENVSGEYRTMIETYYKVVAERAREKK